MKVVVNKCYGGFSLSRKALHLLRKMGDEYALSEVDLGEKYDDGSINDCNFDAYCREIDRSSKNLIKVVEKLGDKSFGFCAKLKIVEIPDDVNYEIHEYDGMESIHEIHKSW